MLDTFRTNASSTLMTTLIGAIALVFIFSFGPGSRGCRSDGVQAGWAARVNGEEVPTSAFDQSLRRAVNFKQLMRRGSYSKEQARADKVREEAMDEVIERELIAQAALKAGLWVSDEDVIKEITEGEQFKKNGAFDKETYLRYVNNVEGVGPKKYEERVRRDLMVRRMAELAFGTITVSDDEARAEYVKGEEAASIEYVRFGAFQFRDAAVTDAEADKYLADHAADVEKKYADNKDRYMEPRSIKARRIHEPVAPNATPEEEAAAKARVEQAKKDLDAGKSWDEVAAGFTNDKAVEDKTGLIGFVPAEGKSPFGKQFEEELFKLKIGERSGVFKTKFGYSIVEALEDKPATKQSFDDVKKQLAKELAGDAKAKEAAAAAASEALAKLKAGTALSAQYPKPEAKDEPSGNPFAGAAALAKKPEARTTEEFHAMGGTIPGVGSVPKVSAAAFALTADKRLPDAVIEDQNAYWVIELKSRKRADLAGFEARKESLREQLVGQKREELRKKWVDGLKKEASITQNEELLSYDQVRAGLSPDDG